MRHLTITVLPVHGAQPCSPVGSSEPPGTIRDGPPDRGGSTRQTRLGQARGVDNAQRSSISCHGGCGGPAMTAGPPARVGGAAARRAPPARKPWPAPRESGLAGTAISLPNPRRPWDTLWITRIGAGHSRWAEARVREDHHPRRQRATTFNRRRIDPRSSDCGLPERRTRPGIADGHTADCHLFTSTRPAPRWCRGHRLRLDRQADRVNVASAAYLIMSDGLGH
jgi:hypothetical protein